MKQRRFNTLRQWAARGYWRILLALAALLPNAAFASEQADKPWEQNLSMVVDSITGPVAYFLSIIAVFGCGLMMAFCDLQGGAKIAVRVVLGLGIAVSAVHIVQSYIGFHGALIA